jgi:hypothetical protein
MKKLDSEKFDKAAQATVSDELAALEKRILSELAGMITEAHTKLTESGVFAKFTQHLNGRKPSDNDVLYFKRLIEKVVYKNDVSFSKYFDVIVERDTVNRATIGFEFKVKPNLFR